MKEKGTVGNLNELRSNAYKLPGEIAILPAFRELIWSQSA